MGGGRLPAETPHQSIHRPLVGWCPLISETSEMWVLCVCVLNDSTSYGTPGDIFEPNVIISNWPDAVPAPPLFLSQGATLRLQSPARLIRCEIPPVS